MRREPPQEAMLLGNFSLPTWFPIPGWSKPKSQQTKVGLFHALLDLNLHEKALEGLRISGWASQMSSEGHCHWGPKRTNRRQATQSALGWTRWQPSCPCPPGWHCSPSLGSGSMSLHPNNASIPGEVSAPVGQPALPKCKGLLGAPPTTTVNSSPPSLQPPLQPLTPSQHHAQTSNTGNQSSV